MPKFWEATVSRAFGLRGKGLLLDDLVGLQPVQTLFATCETWSFPEPRAR